MGKSFCRRWLLNKLVEKLMIRFVAGNRYYGELCIAIFPEIEKGVLNGFVEF